MLSAASRPGGAIRVTVAGLSALSEAQGAAFGMRLVRRLASQIGARLEMEGEAGITLVLPSGTAHGVAHQPISTARTAESEYSP
jgi:hypothetical protein